MARAVRRNQIRRRRLNRAVFAATGFGQSFQDWEVEQVAHFQYQSCLAHALNHADRQQRMAAQLKEIIVASYAFGLSTSAHIAASCRFHLAHRRFVFTRYIGA